MQAGVPSTGPPLSPGAVEVRPTGVPALGNGAFAAQRIPAGTYLGDYTGRCRGVGGHSWEVRAASSLLLMLHNPRTAARPPTLLALTLFPPPSPPSPPPPPFRRRAAGSACLLCALSQRGGEWGGRTQRGRAHTVAADVEKNTQLATARTNARPVEWGGRQQGCVCARHLQQREGHPRGGLQPPSRARLQRRPLLFASPLAGRLHCGCGRRVGNRRCATCGGHRHVPPGATRGPREVGLQTAVFQLGVAIYVRHPRRSTWTTAVGGRACNIRAFNVDSVLVVVMHLVF